MYRFRIEAWLKTWSSLKWMWLMNMLFKVSAGTLTALSRSFCPFLFLLNDQKSVVSHGLLNSHPELFFPSLSFVFQLVESWAAPLPQRRRIGVGKRSRVGGQMEGGNQKIEGIRRHKLRLTLRCCEARSWKAYCHFPHVSPPNKSHTSLQSSHFVHVVFC